MGGDRKPLHPIGKYTHMFSPQVKMGVVGPEPENIQGLSDDFLLAHVLNLSTHFQYKLYLDQVVYVCLFSLQVKMN